MREILVCASMGFLIAALSVSEPARAAPILHTHDAGGTLGTVDVATGLVTVIGSMGVVMTDIAFDPHRDLFGLDFNNFYSIDPLTANVTLIGPHGVSGLNALVFGTDGTLFAAGDLTSSLFTIDTGSGASTDLGDIGFASAGDLAFNGGELFLASRSDGLVRIELGTSPIGTAVGAFGFSDVFGLATADDGILYGVAGTQIFSVNTLTGAGTLVSNFSGQGLTTANGSTFVTEAIPEPSTVTLVAAGLAALAIRRRRALLNLMSR